MGLVGRCVVRAGFLALVSAGMLAAPASAHFLTAVTHGDSDLSTGVNDDFVEAHGEIGIQGPAANFIVGDARVDGATGVSQIALNGAWAAGGSFISLMEASTQLREVLTIDDPGGTGRIRASLTVDANGSVMNVPPAGARVEIEALLYLGEFCSILLREQFNAVAPVEPVVVSDCEELFGTASHEGSTLVAEVHNLFDEIEVRVFLSGELSVGQGDSGTFSADAALRIEALDGATFEPESDTFLTELPEPGEASLAAAALGAIGALARRRSA